MQKEYFAKIKMVESGASFYQKVDGIRQTAKP